MLFDPSTADQLRPWLTRTLEPICDADPEALSNYILALLKHNVSEAELRSELTSQLEEFLEKEGPLFIDTLFTVLRTKSYLPYTDASPPSSAATSAPGSADNGIPIPLDALLTPTDRRRKRPGDYDDNSGRPAKGPRLSHDDQFPRGGSGNGVWDGGMGGMGMGMSGMNGGMPVMMNGFGSQQYQPPGRTRGICRDYHNHGYCSRGAYCKYSHGDDVFVPMFPMNGQFGPMFNEPGMFPMGGGGGGDTYDPHEARMELRPMTGMGMNSGRRAPLLPRDGDPSRTHGELPVIQDLTPRDAAQDDTTVHAIDGIPVAGPSREGMGGGTAGPVPPTGMPTNNSMDVEMDGSAGMHGPHRGGIRGRGRGSRPGTFSGDVQRFRPERRNDKTLVVEKIPEDKLSLDAVNGWFKKFGSVTNIAIDASSKKALVSFSEHEHAHAAWKSEEAVFGNRFVKVFWHRPMEGHGAAGQRLLAASAPTVASLSGRDKPDTPDAHTESAETHSRQSVKPAVSNALAEKQKKLEAYITEQKELMERLKNASGDEKRGIFARLRELGKEIEQTKNDKAVPTAVASKGVTPRHHSSSVPAAEVSQRDLLDKELDLHSAAADGDEETTEALKAKLEKLKAEAASLGIDPNSGEPMYSSPSRGSAPHRPYRGRGRGRGRGAFRGAMRGGPPPNMRLDNRPRRLLVKDVGPDAEQAVRDWYDATGQVDSFESLEGGDLVVSFRTRAAAEQGLAKGANIPLAGHKQILWYTPSTSSSAPLKMSTGRSSAAPDHPMEPDVDRLGGGEDDAVPSGWGDGTEDGMGM
ncbi:hypothetical protein K488DRAFT_44317 [Vararia minispora EC-137]|uniref:Uncharacterized protein n=1 Tax=Vararia minispora EC-137 TaxID=1314806 RepID=A0ACB8QSN0_9AGAM|nr:hypothetical protein K488DRAFT_44317 [Vararia minispora EC-137]